MLLVTLHLALLVSKFLSWRLAKGRVEAHPLPAYMHRLHMAMGLHKVALNKHTHVAKIAEMQVEKCIYECH